MQHTHATPTRCWTAQTILVADATVVLLPIQVCDWTVACAMQVADPPKLACVPVAVAHPNRPSRLQLGQVRLQMRVQQLLWELLLQLVEQLLDHCLQAMVVDAVIQLKRCCKHGDQVNGLP